MPATKTELPKTLKPYTFHGVQFDWEEGRDEVHATCPFCGKARKFGVEVKTGVYKCFVCGTGNEKGGGNATTFVRAVWEGASQEEALYRTLAEGRGLLRWETLREWGVRFDRTGTPLLPGYNAEGKLVQLYRYVRDRVTGKGTLYPTPTLGHGFHRSSWDAKRQEVWVVEGPWDGMALQEAMSHARRDADSLAYTTSGQTLARQVNVMAIPGCGSVGEPLKRWSPLLGGRRVSLLFDSDHPREHEGRTIEPSGFAAMKRAVGVLGAAEECPREVRYLRWGDHGYDPDVPSGYDLRDALRDGSDAADRVRILGGLLERVLPVPSSFVPGERLPDGGTAPEGEDGDVQIHCKPCSDWRSLVTACRKAMRWTDGLDVAFSVMLASIASTKLLGDPIWPMVISPPSTGKSVLCEALSINRKFVKAVSTFKGFHSNYQTDADGTEDHSLVKKLYDMALVTKDGDTLLKADDLGRILSQARDIYDGSSRTSARNMTSRDYTGIRMVWILCGTDSLRQMDQSELGERFLKCTIMSGIDEDLEEEIVWRVVNRAHRNMSFEADGTLESQHDPDMVEMMQLTGGYVGYLRTNARDLASQVTFDEDRLRTCGKLARLVSYMRARPSSLQEEVANREMPARLAIQITRLAHCLAVVLNKREVDDEVMRRVRKVALDTAAGVTLDLARSLLRKTASDPSGLLGKEVKYLTTTTPSISSDSRCRELLRFLAKIGAAEVVDPGPSSGSGLGQRPRWVLADRVRRLLEEVDGSKAAGVGVR